MTAQISRLLLSVAFVTLALFGCQEDEDPVSAPQKPETADKDSIPPTEEATTVYNLRGYVQKGPFINGTTITISELDQKLVATGKNFTTQITDNKGTFSIKSIELQSGYVQLMANGFYFDEVQGEKSTAQLTLFALANLADTSNVVNVNLLSHLEKDRVIYLMQEENKSFATAKKQAQQEILAIFGIKKESIAASENLDITQEGDDNAILLAISVILQGYDGKVGNLAELLANISTDMEIDGVLNDSNIGSILMNNAIYLNLEAIRQNITNRYVTLGDTVEVGDFEKYIHQFINSSNFTATRRIEYPSEGIYGRNILSEESNSFSSTSRYSLTANTPEGVDLKIVLKGGLWYYSIAPAPVNWVASTYNENEKMQEFLVVNSGAASHLNVSFPSNQEQTITIEYYEAGSKEPTKVRKITINP